MTNKHMGLLSIIVGTVVLEDEGHFWKTSYQ